MSKKILYCNECDVEFTVRYGMSDSHYVAKHCVFCGGEINSDEEYIDEEFGEDYDQLQNVWT